MVSKEFAQNDTEPYSSEQRPCLQVDDGLSDLLYLLLGKPQGSLPGP